MGLDKVGKAIVKADKKAEKEAIKNAKSWWKENKTKK